MDSFKNLVPQYALCLRDGQKVTLLAKDLTLGDIIEVKAGDRVPADIRILESRGAVLKSSEADGWCPDASRFLCAFRFQGGQCIAYG